MQNNFDFFQLSKAGKLAVLGRTLIEIGGLFLTLSTFAQVIEEGRASELQNNPIHNRHYSVRSNGIPDDFRRFVYGDEVP
jgi:hypothetical protein